jgi:hypothetical protein
MQSRALGSPDAPASSSPLAAPRATSLLTENTRDGSRNCLDAAGDWLEVATPQIRARSEVLVLRDTRPGPEGNAGHVVIRQGESIYDPSSGQSYANFQSYNSQGQYEIAHTVGGTAMHRILSAPPGSPERQQALNAARIPPSVQGMLLADTPAQAGGGQPIVIPQNVPTTRVPTDPPGVMRVDVARLPEPLRSELRASHAVQVNTGAGTGVSMTQQQGGPLMVAVNGSRQLVDVAGGQPVVFQTGSTNVLSVFRGVNMNNPAQVGQAYASALQLTQGGQRTQPLPTTAPLTADQVSAYQSLGYTVAVLDPSNGLAAVRPPGAPGGQDVANIGAVPGGDPVYVLVGGPPLSTFGDLTPQELVDIHAGVAALPEYAGTEEIRALVNQAGPGSEGAVAGFLAERFTPPPGEDLSNLYGVMYAVQEVAGDSNPRVAAALAGQALNPALAARGANTAELASWSMEMVSTPAQAQALLEAVGPQDAGRFVGALGLGGADLNDPAWLNNPLYQNSGVRRDALTSFMGLVNAIPQTPGAPNGHQAAFTVAVAQQASPYMLESADFRRALGRGLGTVMAVGDPALAASEGARLEALFGNEDVGNLLAGLPASDRGGVMVALMNAPGLTADLVQHHGGNVVTAMAYAQLQGVTQGLTAGFGPNGQVPLGPDGLPMVMPDSQVILPPPEILNAHPAIAGLGQPLDAGTLAVAVQEGRVTADQAANYLDDLAARTRRMTDPALINGNGGVLDSAAAVLINVLNGGNPIEKSRLNEYGDLNADSLERLADLVRASDDPAFIAQAVTAGSAQDATFRNSARGYGDAIAAMGETVQGRRQLIIAGLSVVASMAAPVAAAGLVPAGAAVTVGGVTLGTATLQAGAAGLASGIVSTTLNAAGQYDQTGQVNWGNAAAGGAVDALTTYFGLRLSIVASARGTMSLGTVARGATIDGLGGIGAYALGTPGALQGILNGDPAALRAAALSGGTSFATSFALSSMMDLPGVDTTPRPGNIVMDGVGMFVPMPRLGGAEGWRVHGYRGLRDVTMADVGNILTGGLNPRAVREGRVAPGEIESQPFFQRFWHGVQESAGMNVGENVVMLTRNPALAEMWATGTPVNAQGNVAWMDFARFVAGAPRPTRAEYFSPAQFDLLQANQASAGGTPVTIRDSTGRTLQVTPEQAQAIIGNGRVDVVLEVAAPVENQVGLASFYLSPRHQEEPIVGSVGPDGIIGVTILWDGVLPP